MNNKLELDKSVLIVAHPDDEILWFSSILNDVKKIIFIFKGTENKTVEKGRNKILDTKALPYANKIINLNIAESNILDFANWKMPKQTFYGIQTKSQKYIENFYFIKNKLENQLSEFEHVITHNPWGEYGHEDHVQVFRAVTSLMQDLNYSVWVSKYFSEKTIPLIHQTQNYIDHVSIDKFVDKNFCNQVSSIYKSCNAWTWADYYHWPKKEGFSRIKKNISLLESKKIKTPLVCSEMNFIIMFDRQFTHLSKFRSQLILSCQKIFPKFVFNLIINIYKNFKKKNDKFL